MAINKILVVEDSHTERLFLSDALQQKGYVVTLAEDSEAAERRLKEDLPDLILMDVVMPAGKSGFQLTREITKTPEYAHIPVIMCTSKGMETDKMWGMAQGAKDYITKPVNTKELIAKIRALG